MGDFDDSRAVFALNHIYSYLYFTIPLINIIASICTSRDQPLSLPRTGDGRISMAGLNPGNVEQLGDRHVDMWVAGSKKL